ncbi:hypothetical protein GCM10010277_13530 [Streptomyces longisporoflavus]|uniref:hypothetical protein n=1 Tax=Streptomyces longisporoflavus TaxID=28044 RepID=UPI00199E1A1E|nr:hypothetical protein [Streptomyces longisporoflavus]GGV30181.1 hypothetical protein GCM10010277_13530 [Streptomyces longisporoflavus]
MPRRPIRRAAVALPAAFLLALSAGACSDSASEDDNTVRFGYIGDYNGASLLAK